MDVQYSPQIQQSADVLAKLSQFSNQLGQIIGPESLPTVKVRWVVAPNDDGRAVYRASLEDPVGRVSADFAADEFWMTQYMSLRLRALWGDLLHIHSEKQHEKVERLYREFQAEQRELTPYGD